MISDTPKFDMVVKMKDGSVLLVIVISGIKPTDENVEILKRKIAGYIEAIELDAFRNQYPTANSSNTYIVLEYFFKPPQRFVDMEDELRAWIENEGVKLKIRPEKYSKYHVPSPKRWWQFWK